MLNSSSNYISPVPSWLVLNQLDEEKPVQVEKEENMTKVIIFGAALIAGYIIIKRVL